MRFRDLSTYVYHCHILNHEDGGMMGIVDVTRSGRPSVQTERAVDRMAREIQKAMSMEADSNP